MFEKATPPTFAKPAISTKSGLALGDFAEHLESDPGEWYKVPLDDRPIRLTAYQIAKGVLKAFQPRGSYDARFNDDPEKGDVGVWAMFRVPDPNAPAPSEDDKKDDAPDGDAPATD